MEMGEEEEVEIVGVVAFTAITCGLISSAVATTKGLSAIGYFFVGLILGLIGIVVAICARPAGPATPGWYADPFGKAQYRWWDGKHWRPETA